MYFTRLRIILLFALLISVFTVQAQENLTIYLQPETSLNYKVAGNYYHNFAFSNRSYLFRNEEFEFKARQLDIAHFSSLKVRDNQSIGVGIQYRFREVFENDRSNELRLTQQYNITHKYRSLRFGDRFRTEQRFTQSATIHRFRYRLALDFPLQGLELDVGESYFIVSTESLLSVARGSKPEYDQRITAQLGWLLGLNTKIQLGSEYRFENYTQNTENILFFLTGLVLSL